MTMDEIKKQKYRELIYKYEGEDPDKIINLQIQKVIKETARLIGLLEESHKIFERDSKEFRSIRESGNSFLNDLVLTARELKIQVQ